jgi:hypothetical protein
LHNVSSKQAQELLKSGLLSDLIQVEKPNSIDREEFRKLLGFITHAALVNEEFVVQMKWNIPLEHRVRELTRLGITWADPNINSENYPNPDGLGHTTEKLQFRGLMWNEIPTRKAREILDSYGLVLRHPQILCQWLIQNYDRLRLLMNSGLYLAVLDPIWTERPLLDRVICLTCDGSDRELRLVNPEEGWTDNWLFSGSPKL